MVKWSLLKGLLCWSQHQTPCEQFQPIPHKTGMPWQGEGSSKTSWASGHPWTTPLTVAEEQPHRDRLRSIQPTIIFLTAAKSVASVEECKNRANVWWLFSSTASTANWATWCLNFQSILWARVPMLNSLLYGKNKKQIPGFFRTWHPVISCLSPSKWKRESSLFYFPYHSIFYVLVIRLHSCQLFS